MTDTVEITNLGHNVTIKASDSDGLGSGGSITLRGGDHTTGDNDPGHATLAGGDATAGNRQGGSTHITGGTGSNGVTGDVDIFGHTVTISSDGQTGDSLVFQTGGAFVFTNLHLFNFTDDADAASNGIPVDGLYHTSGTVKVRRS